METPPLPPELDDAPKVTDKEPVRDTSSIEQMIQGLAVHTIGQGTPPDLIIAAHATLSSVGRHPDYADHEEVPFVYEMLDINNENVRMVVKNLAVTWVEKEDNISRVQRCMGRNTSLKGEELLKGFGAFRFKALEPPQWGIAKEGLGMEMKRGNENERSTIVLVALEDWSEENGFFCQMDRGADICIDSKAPVPLPGTGGGLGITFGLKI